MDDDLWQQGRERARAEVRAVFADSAPPQQRTCAFCGAEAVTRFEHCPACGRSFFQRPPRFGPVARRVLLVAGALAVAPLAVVVVPDVMEFRRDNAAAERERRARTLAAERARLTREQRPHRGQARSLRPPAGADAAVRLRARAALVGRLEAAITQDARGRQARGELTGAPARMTQCGPLVRNQRVGDEADLAKEIGRYACVAASRDVVQDGRRVGLYGTPFVAAVNFRRFSFVWCKDNPAINPGDRSSLAFVRLRRECLAARGKAFGTGYLVEP